MAADGKLNVELRLVLDKLKGDIQNAVGQLKATLEGSVSSSMDRVAGKTRKVTDELRRQIDEWRKLNPGGVSPEIKVTDSRDSGGRKTGFDEWNKARLESERGTGEEAMARAQREKAARDAAFARATQQPAAGGALPPIIPPSWFSGIAAQMRGPQGVSMMRNIMAGLGVSYGGMMVGAAAGGPIGMAAAGIQATLMLLRKTVDELSRVFQRAAAQYAQMLQRGGIPMGVAVRENTLAQVIGVSASQVRQFGNAVAFVEHMVVNANRELTRTTPIITAAMWQWRALVLNMQALWSQFAAAIAPGLANLVQVARVFVELEMSTGILKAAGWAISLAFHAIATAMKSVLTVIVGAITALVFGAEALYNIGMKMVTLGKHENDWSNTSKFSDMIKELWKRTDQAAPGGPNAFSDRLPGSAWERMGLVVGAAGNDYAKQTAQATRKTAELLAAIKENLVPRESGALSVTAASTP